MLFEPGQAYKTPGELEKLKREDKNDPSEAEDEHINVIAEDYEAFDQISKRDFVVRRGRNNRILMRSIMRNVFDEKLDEQLLYQNVIKGQNYYVDRYKKVWDE